MVGRAKGHSKLSKKEIDMADVKLFKVGLRGGVRASQSESSDPSPKACARN